ncbi:MULTISPECIES: PRC-barrel domain protein [unclassified Adlercreutzia]|uniref:PRC-barrel domain-containing protein n=1 Tax=unclassified Adlercreutzia TaxID=2636013 RepID=UPI0013EBCA6B|nr:MULTISPECIES: PRC-barrel domain protein [unclassified Adlercreutzia]
MTQRLICTKDLVGMRVWIEKPKKKDPDAAKRMGKVRACVFHPQEKRCVGFIVKRPDLALMFRRKDLFVAYNGYELLDGAILVHDDPSATDKGACNALGVDWDECVLWVGLPVMCQDGTAFGLVGSITYDADTGAIVTLDVTQGATANALLGMRHVPASLIRGFRYGMGAELSVSDQEAGEDVVRGAILVDDAVKDLPVEGGLAEKAGEATAVAGDKARAAVDAAKPKIDEAKAAAGEAATKGAYATGRQLKRATHMFSDFKDEFARASGKARASGASGELGEPDESASLPSSSREAAAAASKADEDVEYVFVDEDGNEVVFVDEDGNVISDPSLLGEAFDFADDVVIEAGKPPRASAAAAAGSRASAGAEGAVQAVGSHLRKAGGMFSAFKEEYDKARKE